MRFKLFRRHPEAEPGPRTEWGEASLIFAQLASPRTLRAKTDGTDVVALIARCAPRNGNDSDHGEMKFRKYHEMGTDRTKRLMQFWGRRQDGADVRRQCSAKLQRFH